MPWMTIGLTADHAMRNVIGQLQSDFDRLFVLAGSPTEALMYQSRDPRDQFRLYFSPLAVEIAQALLIPFHPVECATPDLSILSVLSAHSATPGRN